MSAIEKKTSVFTAKEWNVFRINALIVAAIAVGFYFVAPKGLGQAMGMAFAALLLPLPPVVIYFSRRGKKG